MQKKRLLYPNLYAELARNGLAVSKLAEFMGMTAQNLYGKLRGDTTLSAGDMKAIQEFFKENGAALFSLDYLFSNGD